MSPGRTCPLHYRYLPGGFARSADIQAETLYVIGGLYGNEAALAEIERMAAREMVAPALVFNGDFHWFDVDPAAFERVSRIVLRHVALRGNVETELPASDHSAGCGCAYPDAVDEADVERSNAILRCLSATAARFPELTRAMAALPMHAVAEVAGHRIGIVHGDAESMAGWRFAHDALHAPENVDWLKRVCEAAHLSGFASSHTCLPVFRRFGVDRSAPFVINNGAAGMPNFGGTRYGLITRLSVHPAPDGLSQYGARFGARYGAQHGILHVDALPVHYDADAFAAAFVAAWPAGSVAHISYFRRIVGGPAFAPPHALGLVRAAPGCG